MHPSDQSKSWHRQIFYLFLATYFDLSLLRFLPEATEQEVFLARYLSPEGPELEVSRSVRAVRVQDDRWILSGHSRTEQGRRGQGAMSLRVIPFLTYM